MIDLFILDDAGLTQDLVILKKKYPKSEVEKIVKECSQEIRKKIDNNSFYNFQIVDMFNLIRKKLKVKEFIYIDRVDKITF